MNLALRKCSGCNDDIDLVKDSYTIKKFTKWLRVLFPVIFNQTIVEDKFYCSSCSRENKLKKINI